MAKWITDDKYSTYHGKHVYLQLFKIPDPQKKAYKIKFTAPDTNYVYTDVVTVTDLEEAQELAIEFAKKKLNDKINKLQNYIDSLE